MSDICIGCGATLQQVDETKPGYRVKDTQEYCMRCFKIKHYNQKTEVNLDSKAFVDVLRGIEKDALVLFLVDLFDLDGSVVTGLNRMIQSQDVILVGNKLDLLPLSVNEEKTKRWLRSQIAEYGIKPIAVEVMSAEKNRRIDNIVELINEHQKGRNVYVVGATNVGKSTFINQLLSLFVGESPLTTSPFPGTTLETIEIEMNEALLIDTPGIINPKQATHYLSDSLDLVIPKKEVKPKVYQIYPRTTLFVGGFYRIDFSKGFVTSFVLYHANEIKIHRTKWQNADAFYAEHKLDLLVPPTEVEQQKLGAWKKHQLILQENQEVSIAGLGFFRVNARSEVVVWLPEHVSFVVREGMV